LTTCRLKGGSKAQLVSEAKADLGKLKNMAKVDGVNSISGTVDIRAAVIESRLEGHGRGETLTGSGGMVRAPIATLGVNSGELGVLFKVSSIFANWRPRLTAATTFLRKAVNPASTLSVRMPTTSVVPGLT